MGKKVGNFVGPLVVGIGVGDPDGIDVGVFVGLNVSVISVVILVIWPESRKSSKSFALCSRRRFSATEGAGVVAFDESERSARINSMSFAEKVPFKDASNAAVTLSATSLTPSPALLSIQSVLYTSNVVINVASDVLLVTFSHVTDSTWYNDIFSTNAVVCL